MEEIKVGLYSVARLDNVDGAEKVLNFGFPFVAIDDRSACGMVKTTLEKHKAEIDVTKFGVYLLGYFAPGANIPLYSEEPILVEKCVHLVEGSDGEHE